MHKNVIFLTPDKLTLSIKNRDIRFQNVISINTIITEIIIPTIQIYEERLETDFITIPGRTIWLNRRFSIVFEPKKERILLQIKGAYFLTEDNPLFKINDLIKKMNEYQLDFHITEIDYQYTFKTLNQKSLYKSFLKSKTGYKNNGDKETGFTFVGFGKNIDLLDSYTIYNTIYSVKLYNKSKQLRELDDKIKNETIQKFGEDENIIRLELSYTRKSATVKKLNIELLEKKEIGNKTLFDLINPTDKFQFSKLFLKKLMETL